MFKRNIWKLIVSSLITLSPMLTVFLGADFLPEHIAVHYGFDGNANGWMNPSSAFIVLPLVLLFMHWICMALSAYLEKNSEQSKKVRELTYWIIPVISVTACLSMLLAGIGYESAVYPIGVVVLSASFIIIGNFLPKTTRNVAMGIKVKWALSNDDNWNATHRFAGKTFVCAGVLCLLFLPFGFNSAVVFISVAMLLICVLLPVIYSYAFYKRQLADGKITKDDYETEYKKISAVGGSKAAVIIALAVTVIVCALLFVGSVEAEVDEDSVRVSATFWSDTVLKLDELSFVEYREEGIDGNRINGIGSARLLVGVFQNEEFGIYTRYTYNSDLPCIVLKTENDKTVVIGAETEQKIKELYDDIMEKLASEVQK